MKYLIAILFTFTLYNTNSCKNNANTTAENEEKVVQENQKNTYNIITLNGKDVAKEKLHISFDEERNLISGFSGCNTFSSKYTITDNQISLGFPMASKVYCEKKMELEQEFFKALLEIKTKTISENNISLKGSDGKQLMTGILKN